MLTSPALRKS